MTGLVLLLPELLIGTLAFLVLGLDLLLPARRTPLVGWLAAFGMLAIGVFCATWWDTSGRLGDL